MTMLDARRLDDDALAELLDGDVFPPLAPGRQAITLPAETYTMWREITYSLASETQNNRAKADYLDDLLRRREPLSDPQEEAKLAALITEVLDALGTPSENKDENV